MKFSKTILFICVFTLGDNAYAELNTQYLQNKELNESEQHLLLVNDIEFIGNSIYSDNDLKKELTDKIGKKLTLDQIKDLAIKVQNKYHEAGYSIAKVTVPQQDFKPENPVKIIILEGKLGKVNILGNKNYNSKFITQSLSSSDIVSGKAFTLDALENTLARINRQAGVKVVSVLRPGEGQGFSNIDIQVTEEPQLSAVLEVNNYGSKSTGEYRAIPQIDVTNLTGRGDNLSFTGMHTLDGEGVYYARLAYNTPINTRGTKINGYYAFGNVKVGEELARLDIKGDNNGWGLGILQDYIENPNNLFQFEGWLESYNVKQEILGMKTAEDKIRKLRLGVNYESLTSNSRSFYSLNLHQGFGENFGGMENDSVFSTRAISNADNEFTKISFDWMRLQRITPRLSLIPRLSAQYSFNSLVSGEQISIGGYGSIMGQSASAHSGDSGYNINLEGRYLVLPTSDKYQITAKLDHGKVFLDENFIGQSNSHSLSGASIGFMVNPIKNVSLKFDYGHAIGEKTGKDDYLYFQTKFNY